MRFFKGEISHKEIYDFSLEHIFNLLKEIGKIIELETKEEEKPKLGAAQLASMLKNRQEKIDAETR